MSFTWELIDITGFSTGDGSNDTGTQIGEILSVFVSGLKYDGTGIDNNYLAFITGTAIMASGNLLTPGSGDFFWNNTNDQWEGGFSATNSNDANKYTTGFADWEWNSGITNASTGIECKASGIETRTNAQANAWELLSITAGASSPQDADTEHTHSAMSEGSSQLSELSDVAVDAGISYTDGKVLRADGNSYESSLLYITDIPKLPELSGDFLTVSGDYSTTSGTIDDYTAMSGDYATTSGTVEDYEAVSGDYVDVSGDYIEMSGDYVTSSGEWSTVQTLNDLGDVNNALSGVIISLDDKNSTFPANPIDAQIFYDLASESLYRYSTNAIAWIEIGGGGNAGLSGVDWGVSGAVADVSGDFAELSGDYAELSGDYALLSGDYAELSGDFSPVSGDFSELSGDFSPVSGDYAEVSGDFSSTSGDYALFSGDYAEVSGSFSDLSGDIVIMSGDYVTLSGDYVETSGDYAEFSGDFAETSTFDSITIETGLTSDHSSEGIKISQYVAEAVVFGNLVTLNVDAAYVLTDADLVAKMPVLAMTLETIASGNISAMLLYGTARDETWTWDVTKGGTGALLYAGLTPGTMTQTRPSTATEQVQIIGYALSTGEIMFRPDLPYVGVA